MNAMEKLYQVILERKASAQEGSYTGYLFEQGLDKILKKRRGNNSCQKRQG